ncbi:MAG: sulfotransferase domain-containing protein [Pseudomonadota bacterium]
MQDLRRIIWIASFPKSGNTWLRTFLANAMTPPDVEIDINSLYRFTTADVRHDFFEKAARRSPFESKDFEEWLRLRPRALALIASSKPGLHFVKTHSRVQAIDRIPLIPPAVTAAAIYLIRNPFDVAQSYSRHLAVDLDTTIGMMTDPEARNVSPNRIFEVIGRWDTHISSWLDAPGLNRHVMRYEDMIADPLAAFTELLGFLRADVPPDRVRAAVEATAFDSLRAAEKKAGFRERPSHMPTFFAKGKAGSWREELTPKQVDRLREAFLPAIEKWYPEMLEEIAGTGRA